MPCPVAMLLFCAAVAAKLAAPSLGLVEKKRNYIETVLKALMRQKFDGYPHLEYVILRQA